MNEWKKIISNGNRCFDSKQYDDAKRCYWEAINRTNQLFYSWFDPDEATWAVIVSYQNLADLHEKLDQPCSAFRLMKELYDVLQKDMRRIENDRVDDQPRRLALHRGLSCTHKHLLRLSKKLNIVPKTASIDTQHDRNYFLAESDHGDRETYSTAKIN